MQLHLYKQRYSLPKTIGSNKGCEEGAKKCL